MSARNDSAHVTRLLPAVRNFRSKLLVWLFTFLLAIATLAHQGTQPVRWRLLSSGPSIVIGSTSAGNVSSSLFGADIQAGKVTRLYDSATGGIWPSAQAVGQQLGLSFVRFSPMVNLGSCFSGSDCTYHFRSQTPGAALPTDPAGDPNKMSPDQWYVKVVSVVPSPTALIPVNIEAGTTSEAEDWVAYMNGLVSSSVILGDGTTVAHWAQLRATNGHAQPYGVKYWELGNEEGGLHQCVLSPNKPSCVNSPPTAPSNCAVAANGGPMYACLAADYQAAMTQADPTITIVGDSSYLTALQQTAPGAVGAFDYHEYQPESDPYGTQFDTNAQSAAYTLSPVQSGAARNTAYGLWLTASSSSHVDVTFDQVPQTLKNASDSISSTITASPWANVPQLLYFKALTTVGAHSITVTACSTQSLTLSGTCKASGTMSPVYLHFLTTTPDTSTLHPITGPQLVSTASCGNSFQVNTLGTQVVDTSVSSTTGTTGTASQPGTPWRLSYLEDYPIAATAQIAYQGIADLQAERQTLQTSAGGAFANAPIIVGEYGDYGGCSPVPFRLDTRQVAGLWAAEFTEAIANSASQLNIIGASLFELDGVDGGDCYAMWLVTAPLATPQQNCIGSDAAYPAAPALAMQQFGQSRNELRGTTVTGAPILTQDPIANEPSHTVSALSALATVSGNTVTVVIVNLCPPLAAGETDQCTSPDMAVSLSLADARSFLTASAQSVAAGPYDENADDSSPTTVTIQPVSASLAGPTVTVDVPPFSVTKVSLSL